MNTNMDCGPRCRSKRHALELITAVTRGTTRQIQLYLRRCYNAFTLSDAFGRTVLHMAASRGRWEVVQWLLEECKLDLNAKDAESGWTALHRAIFYGQIHCAKILIEFGANIQTRDKEGLAPLDITMKDRLPHVEFSPLGTTEVFTWGDNTNITLGHDKMQARRQPEVVDFFRKQQIGIKQVVMSKYHTMFLAQDGRVYACGHGRGGRLGLGDEQTIVIPRLVEAVSTEECVQLSAARDHTVLLMASGTLYSCGLNDSHQLGQFPMPTCSLVPKQMNHKVLKGKTIQGVCAQRFHTIVYTKDAIYTFGLNAGQLGHQKVVGEQYVSQPRQVSALNHKDFRVKFVTSSDAAVVVVTARGDVYALHEYQCRKVVSKWLDVVQVGVSGGCLDHNSDLDTLREKGGNDLTIVLLNSAGKAFLWRSTDPVLRRCIWGMRRPLRILQIAISVQNMVFVTQDGEAFIATIPRRRRHISSSKVEASSAPVDTFNLTLSDLVDKEEVEDVRVNRLPLVHRATDIMVDRKGNNFAVLQTLSNACLTDVPSICNSEMGSHFRTLLDESNTFDCIHDVILQVGNEQIAAHRFLLATRSEYFRELLTTKRPDASGEEDGDEVPVVNMDPASPELVRQMLLYIYTDTCDFLKIGATIKLLDDKGVDTKPANKNANNNATEKSVKKKKGGKDTKAEKAGNANENGGRKNPVKMLHELAKKYGVKNLAKRLEAVKYVNGKIAAVHGKSLPSPHLRFERKKYGMLYDVCIRGEDGHETKCHKCVLVARLEYFHSMLASGWIETSSTEALTLPVPSDILHIILDFLYTDECPKVTVCEDVEYLCNLLVVADQLLINRMKDMIEVAIANLLSLRNVCEVLEFASVYNAQQLKATCQQFICLNLAALFELRALSVLTPDVLTELTDYYRNMVGSMSRRLVTPYDDWPHSDYLEHLEQTEMDDPVTHSAGASREPEHATRKHRARRKRTRTKSSGEDLESKGERGAERQTSISSETELTLEMDIVTEQEEPTPNSPEPTTPTESIQMKPINVVKRDLSKPLLQPKKAGPGAGNKTGQSQQPNSHGVLVRTSDQYGVQPVEVRTSSTAVTSQRDGTQPSPNALNISSKNSSQMLETELAASPPDGTPFSLRGIMAEQDTKENQRKSVSITGSGKKMNKLSQKERKRLAAVQATTPEKESPTEPTSPSPTSVWGSAAPAPAWGGLSNVVTSFKELMLDEAKDKPKQMETTRSAASPPPVTPTSPTPSSRKVGAGGDSVQLSWGLPISKSRSSRPAAPTPTPSPHPAEDVNPWQRQRAPPTQRTVSFNEIVSDELEQKATLVKMTNKPLHLIQIEEQAIQELLAHYKAADTWDEYITVTREYGNAQLAKPTWAATQ